jgi:hypoxanthine phosphoribosyltransferase
MKEVILKRALTWEWVEAQIDIASEWVKKMPIRHVTGLPRGGLIPAVMISHRCNLKFIDNEAAKLLPTRMRRQVLVVDDIADSGETLLDLHDYDFLTLTLAYRFDSKYVPDKYCDFIEDKAWLVFPWESKDSDPVQDYLK